MNRFLLSVAIVAAAVSLSACTTMEEKEKTAETSKQRVDRKVHQEYYEERDRSRESQRQSQAQQRLDRMPQNTRSP